MADALAPGVQDERIAEAQQLLARSIARSRAGEDRELMQQVRQGGEAVASALAGLSKLTRVHSAENHAFDAPLAELSRSVSQLVSVLGPLHLVVVDEQVYVNEVRLRTEVLSGLKDLGPDLARHNVGGISFHEAISADEARALVAALGARPADVAPRQELQAALVAAGVRTVELTARLRFREPDDELEVGRDPSETLHRTMHLVEETYANVAFGRVLNPLPLRRAVADLLQIGPATPELWEELHDGLPHTSHAASVTLISLLVGKSAGLATGLLHDLGVAALVHDIGYTSVPADLARTAEGLARHPAEGARALLRQRGFHVAKLRRLRAVLDHHRDHEEPRGAPSLLGEVLRLAEDYTTLLRVYSGRISPVDVLGAMPRAAGRLYHPVLMQIMINALGRFPPGTVLQLEDGRLVRCVAPARSPETFALPLVREMDPGTGTLSGERIDLALGGAIARVVRR